MVRLLVYSHTCGYIPKLKVWESPISSVVIFLAQLRVKGLGDFMVWVSVFNQFRFHTESFVT
jgi:hypothetical protein